MQTIPLSQLWVITNYAARCGTSVCDDVVYVIEAEATAALQERRDAQEKNSTLDSLYYEKNTLEGFIAEARSEAREAGYSSATY